MRDWHERFARAGEWTMLRTRTQCVECKQWKSAHIFKWNRNILVLDIHLNIRSIHVEPKASLFCIVHLFIFRFCSRFLLKLFFLLFLLSSQTIQKFKNLYNTLIQHQHMLMSSFYLALNIYWLYYYWFLIPFCCCCCC